MQYQQQAQTDRDRVAALIAEGNWEVTEKPAKKAKVERNSKKADDGEKSDKSEKKQKKQAKKAAKSAAQALVEKADDDHDAEVADGEGGASEGKGSTAAAAMEAVKAKVEKRKRKAEKVRCSSNHTSLSVRRYCTSNRRPRLQVTAIVSNPANVDLVITGLHGPCHGTVQKGRAERSKKRRKAKGEVESKDEEDAPANAAEDDDDSEYDWEHDHEVRCGHLSCNLNRSTPHCQSHPARSPLPQLPPSLKELHSIAPALSPCSHILHYMPRSWLESLLHTLCCQ